MVLPRQTLPQGGEESKQKKKVACHRFPFKAPAPTENGPRKRVVQKKKKDVQKGSSKALGPVVRQSRGREKKCQTTPSVFIYSVSIHKKVGRMDFLKGWAGIQALQKALTAPL